MRLMRPQNLKVFSKYYQLNELSNEIVMHILLETGTETFMLDFIAQVKN